MAYNALARGDHEIASDSDNSSGPTSPMPRDAHFPPLPAGVEDFGGTETLERAEISGKSTASRLNSLIRSMASTGTSYDMVEADDYQDDLKETPTNDNSPYVTETTPTRQDRPPTPPPHASHHQFPLRSASIGRDLPLRHPTPDLQSIQGAYIGNVERLEQSAERLSMSSSVEEELQKLKSEQRKVERQYSAPVGATKSQPLLARQFSTGSHANSIIDFNNAARAGYSLGGYITSPHGSIRSGTWQQSSLRSRNVSQSSRLSTLPEPQQEGRPLDSPLVSSFSAQQPPAPAYQPDVSPELLSEEPETMPNEQDAPERPLTSASNDTFRQANLLFGDFDGVHYHQTPSRQASIKRQVSIDRPPLATQPQAHEQPDVNGNMVFYPAPVPMMLNLPQKLSKLPSAAERERRRLMGISHVPMEARKSAAWLNDPNVGFADKRRTRPISNLPPQLRASAFFDQPTPHQEVRLKDASAIATLDSILDAAAYAPVSAFTDHPIAGRAGAKNVYARPKTEIRKSSANLVVAPNEERKSRRMSSFSNLLKPKRSSDLLQQTSSEPASRNVSNGRLVSRESKAQLDDEAQELSGRARGSSIIDRSLEMERAAEQSLLPSDDELGDERSVHSNEDGESEEDDEHNGSAPTTLLAELQRRKMHQKQRNRTAVTAYPDGMHSTLLELDTIAQIQKKSRKQKHVTLAWEDHDEAEKENFNDEDVPLGVLFPGKENATSQRQMGLMEKREAEENEPLSNRRARLRGEPVPNPRQSMAPSRLGLSLGKNRSSAMLSTMQKSPIQDGPNDGETLGQRARRLKAQKEADAAAKTPITGEFASDVLSMFKDEVPPSISAKAKGKQKVVDAPAEETLGQRRRRLREEAESARKTSQGKNAPSATVHARPGLSTRHSLADILTGYPAGGPRKVSDEKRNTLAGTAPRQASLGAVPTLTALNGGGGFRQNSMPMWNANGTMNGAATEGFHFPTMVQGTAFPNGIQGNMPWQYMPANRTQYVRDIDVMGMGPPLDTKQRAQIERWRSSIVL